MMRRNFCLYDVYDVYDACDPSVLCLCDFCEIHDEVSSRHGCDGVVDRHCCSMTSHRDDKDAS